MIDKIKWPVTAVILGLFVMIAAVAYFATANDGDDVNKAIVEKCSVVTPAERAECVAALTKAASESDSQRLDALRSRVLNECSSKIDKAECARGLMDALTDKPASQLAK